MSHLMIIAHLLSLYISHTERSRHTSKNQITTLQTLCTCKQLVWIESNLQDLSCFQQQKHLESLSDTLCKRAIIDPPGSDFPWNAIYLPEKSLYIQTNFLTLFNHDTDHCFLFRISSKSQETVNVAGSKSTRVRLGVSLSTTTRSPTLSLKAGTCQHFLMVGA